MEINRHVYLKSPPGFIDTEQKVYFFGGNGGLESISALKELFT